MADNHISAPVWHKIARDGTFAILLSYLIWFLTNTVTENLTNIQNNGVDQIRVLNEINYAIRGGNQTYSYGPPSPSSR